MTRVSAGIVSYNSAKQIKVSATGLFENTKRYPLTVYVIDNCSTDQTKEIVKKEIPQVVLIESDKNGGFGYGHNRVLPFLESDYHVIVNPDIIIHDDVISDLVDYMEAHKDVAMAMPAIKNVDGTTQYLPKKHPKYKYLLGGRLERLGGIFRKWRREYTMYGQYDQEPVEIEFCTGCFMMIRTELFKKLGGFDERFFMYFEDADLTRQAAQYGKIMLVPQYSVTHEWERASAKKLKFFRIQLQSMKRYFKKWKKIEKSKENKNG